MKHMSYSKLSFLLSAAALLVMPTLTMAQEHEAKQHYLKTKNVTTQGTVTVEGHRIDYEATAGNIYLTNSAGDTTAKMFYVAYTKDAEKSEKRPVTFFWNGGPGSSSVWLHMGAFGPRRVVINDHTHTPPAPYKLVNNDYSLLDVTDEVFVDAVGTGYSRVIDKKKGGAGTPKDFYGIDGDAHSFAQFIRKYLSQNNRWNSPKYIFGESYGTTRAALLSQDLEMGQSIDPNGVILLSSILDFHTDSFNAGYDLPYELFLPTYTAVAWYHHKLPDQPAKLQPLLAKVEQFASTEYLEALNKGNELSPSKRANIIQKLHDYTGLSEAYIKKANLRVTASEFEKQLLSNEDETTGRLDARYAGPTMDPLSQTSEYDPQGAAISSAFVSMFNDYVHNVLKYGRNMHYLPASGSVIRSWNWKHRVSTDGQTWPGSPNVAVNLVQAMKYNPKLKVLVNCGYYDLATPFYAAMYTVDHMALPEKLQKNITEKFYHSGHMVYVHVPSLKKLHDNVAHFILSNENEGK